MAVDIANRCFSSAEIEHIVVSNVKRIIPEQVKTLWHEYRHVANDKVEIGDIKVEESAEAAGWGVQEADARKAQEGASRLKRLPL